MCAVLGVIIIVMFVSANSVNRNVVRNMKGKALFCCDGLKLYDFDNDIITDIAGKGCFDGKFTDDGKIVYADGGNNVFFVYDPAENKVLQDITIDKGDIKGLTYSKEKKSVILIIYYDGRYMINVYSGDDYHDVATIVDSEYEICGLDVSDGGRVYFTVYDGKTGTLESVDISGGTPDKELNCDRIKLTSPCAGEGDVFVCENKPEDSDIVRYRIKTGKVTVPKFNSDEISCTSLVMVSDEEYITSCNKDDTWGLYVCNGSNIVFIDSTNCHNEQIEVTDYCKK